MTCIIFFSTNKEKYYYLTFEETNEDSIHFVKSSTTKLKFAIILAMQRISNYLNTAPATILDPPFSGANLSKNQISQLLYAFQEEGVFEGESLKEVKARFEKGFGHNLSSFNKHWSNYKKEGVKRNFLDQLSDRITNRANKEIKQKLQRMRDLS